MFCLGCVLSLFERENDNNIGKYIVFGNLYEKYQPKTNARQWNHYLAQAAGFESSTSTNTSDKDASKRPNERMMVEKMK